MASYQTLDPKALAQPQLHGYLLSAVAPRPICFASTIDKAGQVNLSPFSFFNVFSSNPPIMIFSPARRGRDNTTKHSYENVLEVPECVINIVNFPIVEQMSLASTEYEKGVNEFVKSGLTELPSTLVKPPRVAEAPVAFECKINEVKPLGDGGGAGNLVIAEVLLMHIQKQYLDAEGKLDTVKLDLVSRMGGSWYCRATGDALFEIPKPIQTKGIGVDQLPESIRHSTILTGNNLGRLGNMEALPDDDSVEGIRQDEQVKAVLLADVDVKVELHVLAQSWLEAEMTEEAMRVLLLAERL